jgi:hypothetical protein
MTVRKSWMINGSSIGADPEFFTAWTLYDLSPNDEGGKYNLDHFFRIISGHGQPLIAGVEQIEGQDISGGLMGEHAGVHTVWCLKWINDRCGIMNEDTLAIEFENLRLKTGLEETCELDGNVVTQGPLTNTFFIRHDSF